MSVLLIAEHNNKELKSFTLNAVTAASQIDTDVHAWTSVSIWDAAVTAFKVKDFNSLLLCSAINNTDIKLLLPHFLIFELIQQH